MQRQWDGNASDSTGGLNRTLQGGASFAAGEVKQAFQFDGSTGSVSLGNPSKLQFTSAMTIEAWINPNAGPVGTGNMAAVLSKWAQQFNPSADTDAYGLWLRNTGTGLTMFTAIHQAGTSEPNIQGGSIALEHLDPCSHDIRCGQRPFDPVRQWSVACVAQ